jgi:hypothetical protein
MQTEKWSLQDAKNRFSAEIDAAHSSSFIDHLLSMPTDDNEFVPLDIQLRDFHNVPNATK